jgi:predicted DNA-binding transcriptional regulator AlpA
MDDNKFLRMKGVAAVIGVSRHTLRRIIERDPTFPPVVELSPGIRMWRERDVREWLNRKYLAALERAAPVAPIRAKRAN